MRVINGIHRENKGYSWDWEQGLKMTDRLGGETCLDTMLGDVENNWHYPQVRRAMGPQFLVHIRMYSETSWENPNEGYHWINVDPAKWAQECVRRLSQERLRYNGILPIDDPYVILSFANEQDLADEGLPSAATWDRSTIERQNYDLIWSWSRQVVEAFNHLAPSHKCKIGTNPLAGGHDVAGYPPDYEYQLGAFKAYVALCDVILLHAYFYPDGSGTRPDNEGYWSGIRCLRPAGYRESVQGHAPVGGVPDPGGVAVQYPDKAFMVSEFGNFRHYDSSEAGVVLTLQGYRECYQAYSNSERCLLVTPFIWNSADEHRQNRIRGNDLLTRGLQDLQRYVACDWPYKGGRTVGKTYEFKLAFAGYAAQHPEIGKATSDISYYPPSNHEGHQLITQWTEKGKLEYNEGAGVVGFFPFA